MSEDHESRSIQVLGLLGRSVVSDSYVNIKMVRARILALASRAWWHLTERSGASPRLLGLILAIGLNLICLVILANETRSPPSMASDIHLVLAPIAIAAAPQPVPQVEMIDPASIEVPTPDVQVAPNPDAVSAITESQIIAPRPDPAHPNPPPDAGSATVHAAEVILRILVLDDGSIGDATVAGSCGIQALDTLALAYAKAHWRYLPAMLADHPVQAWTTVIVRFS